MGDDLYLPIVFGTARVSAVPVTVWDKKAGADNHPATMTVRLAVCQGNNQSGATGYVSATVAIPMSYWRIWRDGKLIPQVQLLPHSAAYPYAIGDHVSYSGRYYTSLQNKNLNHTPPGAGGNTYWADEGVTTWWYGPWVDDTGACFHNCRSWMSFNGDRNALTASGPWWAYNPGFYALSLLGWFTDATWEWHEGTLTEDVYTNGGQSVQGRYIWSGGGRSGPPALVYRPGVQQSHSYPVLWVAGTYVSGDIRAHLGHKFTCVSGTSATPALLGTTPWRDDGWAYARFGPDEWVAGSYVVGNVRALFGHTFTCVSNTSATPIIAGTTPWRDDGWMEGNDARPPLSGVVHIRATRFASPNGENLPNLDVEVRGMYRYGTPLGRFAPADYVTNVLDDDADPADVLLTLLTDPRFGIGLPTGILQTDVGPDGIANSSYRRYCQAEGFYVSRAINDPTDVESLVSELLRDTNSVLVQSDGLLKIRPLGDAIVTGNGVTYTPTATSTALTLADIKGEIVYTRAPDSDVYNCWPVEIEARENMAAPYEAYTAETPIRSDAYARGETRRAGATQSAWIKRRAHAYRLSHLLGYRSVFHRASFEFVVGPRHSLLEPTDYVTLTDADFGLSGKLCRITSMEESGDGEWRIVAEEWPTQPANLTAVPYLTPIDGGSLTAYTANLTASATDMAIMAACSWPDYGKTASPSGYWQAIREIRSGANIGRLLAVGPASAAYSDDGGREWVAATTLPTGTYSALEWNGSVMIAVGINAGATAAAIMTTPDGVTWTSRTVGAGSTTQFLSVAVNDAGVAVAVGYYSSTASIIQSSTDGTTWVARTPDTGSGSKRFWGVAYGGGLFVAVADNGSAGTPRIQTSPDGTTWTERFAAASGTSIGVVAYLNGLWLAMGPNSYFAGQPVGAYSSTDGVTWSVAATPPVAYAVTAAATGIGVLVVTGMYATGACDSVAITSDGVRWREADTSLRASLWAICFAKGPRSTRNTFVGLGQAAGGTTNNNVAISSSFSTGGLAP